ncbi:hypothetical protein V8P95_15190 [Acinetobacter baumannii]|nr:hypothetical protein [Acinetobacter baumannii]
MKILFLIISLFSASTTYAECIINSNSNNRLHKLLQERGWDLNNYNLLCQKLKKSNIGLDIDGITQISSYQTTATTQVRAYALELAEKKQFFPSNTVSMSITSHPERTTNTEMNIIYRDAMNAVNKLVEDDTLDVMINEVNQLRRIVKQGNISKK